MIRSFKLGGKTFKVEMVSHDTSNLGMALVPLNTVQIQRKWGGKNIPKLSMEQTLYHEMIHCVFTEIGRDDLNEEESLVQSIALLVHQFDKTKK